VVRAFPLPTGEMDNSMQVVQHIAWNIVMGGCLAIVTGWFGSRASKRGPNARP